MLPLHYPLPHHGDLQPVTDDQPLPSPAVGTGCSCRDPGCGQPGKHPLGSLVPHGVKDATTNRARILAWWTRHPQANIGLATGHRFDVLDVDGPAGAQAIRSWPPPMACTARGRWSAPAGVAGISTWPRPASATSARPSLEHVDWRGRGGYVVAPPSRHASGHPYQWVRRPRPRDVARRGSRGAAGPAGTPQRHSDPLVRWSSRPPATAQGDRYARAALAEELARVATAPVGQRNRQLWESTRNLYNLVATGALDHREVDQGLLDAAERCGLLGEEPRQTRRTLASGRQVGLAHPRPPTDSPPAPNAPMPRRPAARAVGETDQGEGVMAMAAAGHRAG